MVSHLRCHRRMTILFPNILCRDKDEVQKIYEAELSFTESCLKVNPKSYGSWHHRGWVSARLPRPDWARELTLCDRCLSLDDRNCEWEKKIKRSWMLKMCNNAFFKSNRSKPCPSLHYFYSCSGMFCVSVLPSPLLGLPPNGCKDVWRACRSGIGIYWSSYWLQLFQLLQLALP